MKKSLFRFDVHDITEIAMLCSVAILLDQFVKIDIGSTGGSINFAMAPLFILSLRHGWFKGAIGGGIIFGIISCLIDGYGLQTYPLEYLIAFGSVAITGIFASYINKHFKTENKIDIVFSYGIIIATMLLSGVIRYFCATIDSVLFYDYTWVEAFGYHAPYVFPSIGCVIAIVCLLMPAIKVLNNTYPTCYLKEE